MGFSESIPYSEYHCLLHTSKMENLSIVWCEALYSRVPVITFDVGGASEIISEDNGVLVPPYDIEKMSIALETIFDDEISFNFEESWAKEFTWDMAAKKYQKVLLS